MISVAGQGMKGEQENRVPWERGGREQGGRELGWLQQGDWSRVTEEQGGSETGWKGDKGTGWQESELGWGG